MDAKYDDFLINEVSRLAYLIYLGGDNPGDSFKDWLDAEKLVQHQFRYIYIPHAQSRAQ
jgi:hypothetical protein